MGGITVLPESVINKIAAGEVIERPASVVKELIENSIDAGARHIDVEIREGGKSLIRVKDDGKGMSPEDARIACLRHSTSKISSAEDLCSISTLGFRGEALASIAAVSRMRLLTKERGSSVGILLEYEGGMLVKDEAAGCPEGTIIEVHDLFFNTPARKKFQKSIMIETSRIADIIERYALADSMLHMKLISNGKVMIELPPSDHLSRFSGILGQEAAGSLVMFNAEHMHGAVSRPSFTRGDRSGQTLFVNGRYVKSKAITDAVYEGYRSMLFVGRHPVFVVYLELDKSRTDVNVHPTKSEIRIEREKELCEGITTAVRMALVGETLIPEQSPRQTQLEYQPVEASSQQVLTVKEETLKLERLPSMRIVGVVGKTYIIAETGSGMILIDQHAAAERVMYEKLRGREDGVKKQSLLAPVAVELEPSVFELALSARETLDKAGFETEAFGRNELLVRTKPHGLAGLGKEELADLIHSIASDEKLRKDESAVIMAACKASIKAGDEITLPEIRDLIEKLEKRELPYTCPHGRPVSIQISYKEIEKMFKRSG